MLLSQRIAQDPEYLKKIYKKHFIAHPEFRNGVKYQDLRMRIIHATKFIVGQEMLFIKSGMTEMMRSTIELITGKPAKTDPKEDVLKEADRERFIAGGGDLNEKVVVSIDLAEEFLDACESKDQIYAEFVRLPFDSMVIENESGLVLLERTEGINFTIQVVSVASSLSIFTLNGAAIIDQTPKGGDDPLSFLNNATFIGTDIRYGDRIVDQAQIDGMNEHRVARIRSATSYMLINMFAMIGEILLFANVSNVRTPIYTPGKKEIKAVPKPLQEFYTYRILDIFRERKEYHSMEEVDALINRSDSDLTHRRAHMVRGHFKKKNGKLFWWNAFMRNRRNLESSGFVDKDYHLQT